MLQCPTPPVQLLYMASRFLPTAMCAITVRNSCIMNALLVGCEFLLTSKLCSLRRNCQYSGSS